MSTTTKRATRRLAASIAISTALATSSAWARTEVGKTVGEADVRTWAYDGSDSEYLAIGCASGATGIVNNVSGNFNVGTWMAAGWKNGAYGELHINSGTVTVNGSGNNVTFIGYESGSEGLVVVDGGTLLSKCDLRVGHNGTGTLTINGGTVEVGSSTTEKWTYIGSNSGSTGTINLNGGQLKTAHVRKNNGAGSLVFNGGTLVANKVTGNLIRSGLPVTVNAGGGTIDNGGLSITIAATLSGTGGLTFTGTGTTTLNGAVNYSGTTAVTPGTTLAVANETAKNNILSHGLVVVGVPTAAGQTVMTYTSALDDADLTKVSCPLAPTITFVFSDEGKTNIVVGVIGPTPDNYWTGAAKDGDLSNAANWANGLPTGNACILCATPATLAVGDAFSPDTITILDGSAVVTIGAGDLQVNTLTNAAKLAIAQGASLTVANDLVTTGGAFLHNNEGSVTVGGKARGYTRDAAITIYQYETVTANTQPIRAKGLAYDGSGSGKIYMHLSSQSEKDGMWVLGSDGMTFSSSRNANYSRFYAERGAHVMLYSSSDWTLGQNNGGASTDSSLYAQGNTYDTSITLDTSDYDDPTIGRSITLNGRLHAWGAGASFTVKGRGTVVVDTIGDLSVVKNNTRFDENTTLYVTDTATLQVNAGKKILGSGTISLAAGTTLALDSSALGTIGDAEFTPCIPGLALPTTGTATLRIDGARLRSGDHVIAAVASGTKVELDPASPALDGRKGTLSVEGGQLILNINPDGLMIIFR